MSSAFTFVRLHDWLWSPIDSRQRSPVRQRKTVDGKSLLGITSLLAKKGTVVTIEADGEDESSAVEALSSLVQGGFQAPS